MADDLRITFEMELERIEGEFPTERLRLMWSFAMSLIEQLQAAVLSRKECDSGSCHDVFVTTVEAGC